MLTDFFGHLDAATAVSIDHSGRILAAGEAEVTMGSFSGEKTDFALARYNQDGSLDTANFGNAGLVNTDIHGGFTDVASGMALQSDGKVILAGSSQENGVSSDFGLARYIGNHADLSLVKTAN